MDVGGKVVENTVVCIIEAMKIMNEIQAETKGTIVEVLVENGQPVEYGQRLFKVKQG
jgi:biotin carboxyl carrier protein